MDAVKVRTQLGPKETIWQHETPLLVGAAVHADAGDLPAGQVVAFYEKALVSWPVQPIADKLTEAEADKISAYGILDAACKAGDSVRVGIRGCVKTAKVTVADGSKPTDEQTATLRTLGLFLI